MEESTNFYGKPYHDNVFVGNGYKYTYKDLNEFGDGVDYYAKAEELYSKADKYADNLLTSIKSNGQEVEIDDGNAKINYKYIYNNKEYIAIGPYKVKYNKEEIEINTERFEIYEDDNTKIDNGVILDWDKNKDNVTIIINKENMPSKIKKIKIHYWKTELNATLYMLTKTNSQNIITGDASMTPGDNQMDIEINKNLIPPVQVKLDKVDTAGAAVDGAEFKIVYSNGLPEGMAGSNEKGEVTFPKIQPTSPDSFTATITEINAPSGYKLLEEPIVLKFTYNNGKWKVATQGQKGDVNGDGKIDIKDAELVQKYAQEILRDTESENFNKDNADMDNDGRITLSDARIILQIAEGKITAEKTIKEIKEENNVVTITVPNKSIIEKLTLLKTSSVSGGKVEGAKFKLTLTNVASIKNHQIPEAGKVTIIETTNSDGNLVLEDIEIKNLNEPVVITIEEIEAPVGYKKIEGTITVTLKREGNGYNISETKKDSTVTDAEFEAGKVTLKNHELTLTIKDIPIMNLGGIVWYEGEIIDKDPTHAEAERKPLEDVKVSLYKGNNKEAVADTTSSDGTGTATYTNNKGEKITENLAKGEYMFTDIPAGDDYYVVFEYDGIKYQAITNSKEQAYISTTAKDSKIEKEPNRDEFNKATTTISGSGKEDESITNAGWIIKYDLDNNSTPNKAIYKATYKNEEDMKNNIQQYVKGQTYTYLKNTADWMGTWNTDGTINKAHYAFDINCGLNKKFFDLSLGTDVKEATVKINGNQTTYTYDQILDGKLDEALNRPSKDKEINYNLYLAYSDYYYRIKDYKVPEEGAIKNKYDEEVLSKGQIELAKKDSELKVYVTYRIELKNQSTQYYAKVNLIKYRFDEHYQYVSIKNATAEKDPNARVLYITPDKGIEAGTSLKDIEKDIEITFEVLPDGDNKCVRDTDYLNQAEIVSYTTGGGLVDEDSAPGNAFLEEGKVRYEDDTDEANGIQIKLKENAERSISGKVFDDDDTSDKGINDVIVQLIELVEINNKQYEYIWQETVAGIKNEKNKNRTVKTTARNGYEGESYSVTNEDGEYKFTQGIIPGNYIVRFIYGDGSTYDITDNTLKYNGEDYKSTYVNYNYNEKWYNNTSLNGENSKAVDNEARRLRVMSYAVDVDGKKGAELAKLDGATNAEGLKDVLANTWMCAETLKIKVPVDPSVLVNENGEKEEKLSITENSTSVKKADSQYKVTFDNVNLGLMERPKTKLVLEKYITGLTVRPVASGVNLIANATADINKIIDKDAGATIELEGQKDGLFATKSGRGNRGLWYLQTDTTELAQGADAYITYTYVIKNEGDDDYLSSDLINEYITNIDKYPDYLIEKEADVKKKLKSKQFTKGTYLTEAYYKKNVTLPDTQKVLASVEELQEALNPKVKFVNSTTDFSKKDRDPNIKYAYYDTNGNIQANDSSINEIITSTTGTEKMQLKGVDTSKKLVVSVGLSASEIENGGVYDSYIAQVTHYTNAAGRRDQSTPDNLSYVHSYDAGKTLEGNNEEDEFWAERFTITKPTGEDKITPVQIAIITISAVAVLGVGIILIKKFVLKK